MNTHLESRAAVFTPVQTTRTHTKRSWLVRRVPLITLISAASVTLLGCTRDDAKAEGIAPHVVRVVEIDAKPSASHGDVNYTGVVRARTESQLGFRVGGKISERLVNTGEAVKVGQPLLKLDPTDYQLALQAARAVNKQASLELERVRVLVEKRAESRDVLERAIAAAESSAAQAEQTANQAGYTTLFADADGIVMTTLAEPGQIVAAGQPVLVLAKDGAREAAVDIPEGSLERIRGRTATARLYLNAEATVPATFREISGVADPVVRTYQARYVLEGDPAQFPLGSTVTVRVFASDDDTQRTTEIPLGSLIDRGEGAAVWIVDPTTSTLQKRAVSVAKLGAETALIDQGLNPGDVVVSLGAQLLNAGETVRVAKFSTKDAK
jgi:RND family efflux transporter MFP subunit